MIFQSSFSLNILISACEMSFKNLLLGSLFLMIPICSNPHSTGFEGFFEEYGARRLELIAKYLPKDPVIFEAGGHYGIDTVKFAQMWPESTIFSFEPNPHAFEKLLAASQGFSNIHPQNLAVNSYNGIATLHVCHGSTGDNPIFEGASSLLEPSDWMKHNYQGPKVDVPCVILDDWCKNHHVDHIDFMWLDLEGLELQVLKSSPEILRHVKVIYTETNFLCFRKNTTSFASLKYFLTKSGFKMLAHWYLKGFQGDAIFVRKDLFHMAFDQA